MQYKVQRNYICRNYSKFDNEGKVKINYFWRGDLSKLIQSEIKKSKYTLPLKKYEIEEIIESVKPYYEKYIKDKKRYYFLKELEEKLEQEKDKYRIVSNKSYIDDFFFYEPEYTSWPRLEEYKKIKNELQQAEKDYFKSRSKGIYIEDFYNCNEITQELIALGLVGFINIDKKYIEMYRSKTWSSEYIKKEDYTDDYILLSTGDDWDYNPELEYEQEALMNEYEPIDCYFIEKEDHEYDNNLFVFDKYVIQIESNFSDKFRYNFITEDEANFIVVSNEILDILTKVLKKEINDCEKYENIKNFEKKNELENLKVTYYRLQKEIYKRELRELINIDINNCDKSTVDLILDVVQMNSKLYLIDEKINDYIEEIEEYAMDSLKKILKKELSTDVLINYLSYKGEKYIENAEYKKALLKYDTLIKLDENYKNAYVKKAQIYNQQQKHGEAIKECDKAIKIDENYIDAYNEKAEAYERQEKYKEAILVYTKIIEIYPDEDDINNAFSHNKIAEIHKKLYL